MRLSASDFPAVKQAGFDHVRCLSDSTRTQQPRPRTPCSRNSSSASIGPFAKPSTPDSGSSSTFTTTKNSWRTRKHTANGFSGIWRQIADRFKDQPGTVAFELLNEPCDALVASVWNEILADVGSFGALYPIYVRGEAYSGC